MNITPLTQNETVTFTVAGRTQPYTGTVVAVSAVGRRHNPIYWVKVVGEALEYTTTVYHSQLA